MVSCKLGGSRLIVLLGQNSDHIPCSDRQSEYCLGYHAFWKSYRPNRSCDYSINSNTNCQYRTSGTSGDVPFYLTIEKYWIEVRGKRTPGGTLFICQFQLRNILILRYEHCQLPHLGLVPLGSLGSGSLGLWGQARLSAILMGDFVVDFVDFIHARLLFFTELKGTFLK